MNTKQILLCLKTVTEALGIEHRGDIYSAGSWGPEAAEQLIERQGHQWIMPA